MDPESFFDGHPLALEVFRRVSAILAAHGPTEVRTTRSQVAFRRRRGFAYLWLPEQYLRRPAAPVVLSIARSRQIDSPRFKEVVHPARTIWMHHLELRSVDELDDEVAGWLGEACEEAGPRPRELVRAVSRGRWPRRAGRPGPPGPVDRSE